MKSKAPNILLAILISVPIAFLEGVALRALWGWFIVPLGVVGLGKAHALGLGTLVNLMTLPCWVTQESEKGLGERAFSAAFCVGALWATGWLYHLMMVG
jgi:hypothetical protein